MNKILCAVMLALVLPAIASANGLKNRAFVDQLVAGGHARTHALALETVARWLRGSGDEWKIPMTRLLNNGLNNSMLAGKPDPRLMALEPYDHQPTGLLLLLLRERGVEVRLESLFEGAEFTLYLPAGGHPLPSVSVAENTGGSR